MSHPKISAVLITRLSVYPEIILERIDQGDFFDEILIQAECKNVYARYIAASQAKNDIIFTIDDDALVNHQELFKQYNGKITNAMPRDFQEKYKNSGVTLVGWGAYFPKQMVTCFNKYIDVYGVDYHLLREADRIFTYLNQPFNTVTMPHEDLFQDETRMGQQPNHYQSMAEAIEKCKTLL